MSINGGGQQRIFAAERILAMDGTEPQAFATEGERIIASGSRATITTRFPSAERVDLDGAMIVPGFNDAHCHVSQAALARVRVDLTSAESPTAVRDAMRRRVHSSQTGEWIIGQAFDGRLMAGEVDRKFLDTVSQDHPIIVVHYSFHRAVGNSRALELLGYRRPTDAPFGGELLCDVNGELNGWMLERAWLDPWLPGSYRTSVAPTGEVAAQVAALKDVNQEVHATGVTSYCDAIVTPVEQLMYATALRSGALTPRVNMLLWHSYFDELESSSTSAGSERLRLAGIKMMLDGALSGGTCLCQEPYPSETGTGNGLQVLTDEEFAETVRRVDAADMRVAVHANGDLAVRKVLEVIESLPTRTPDSFVNHRIEHCSIVDDRLIRRIKSAGIIPVPFGAFIHYHGNEILSYYGEDRAQMICAHKSMLDAGVAVAGSSDYPLVPINPLVALQSMVTRTTLDGRVLGPKQRLSVEEALGVYTSGSAGATGEGDSKGRLAPGQLADFVVLDQDLMAIHPEDIGTTAVLSTWVGAEPVWQRALN